MESFWQYLPEIFRILVIQKLDFKSRCCLRKCSKSDRNFVDAIPVFLESLTVKLGFNNTARLKFKEADDSENPKFHPSSQIIEDIILIFKNQKSKAQTLKIEGFFRNHDPLTRIFLEELIAEIQENGLKLNTTHLIFWIGSFNNDEIFVELVKIMNPNTLEKISVCHGTSRKGMEILVETEQWRSLKKFSFGEIENVDVNWLLNLERIRFSVGKFLAEDIWILVQNFLNKNYPIQSYVDIYLTENADVNNMLMFLEEQNVIVKNEPISERDANTYIHTQRFTFPNEDKILLLKMNHWKIYGFVGRSSRYN
ncbi:hypothetical protein L5515_006990 [Caenorhabditis briggsae]|uniref:F-box domain-containing protein n=1 Tax=Caenorhabditis briggsae TaxID=6238 RepID=A0AAE9F1R2_CAEBR|nr:hypothetical protein L5515_006990 [Caenorhabditis briggsae]